MKIEIKLPTMGVGSYATPGWLFPFRQAIKEGTVGTLDIEEAFDDATRIVIGDQIEAGVDIISDGELRRQRFVYEMYSRIDDLQALPIPRKLGVPGYDRAPNFVAETKLSASQGLGLVSEYKQLRRLAPNQLLKIAFPGPLTFARNITPGAFYRTNQEPQRALLDDIIQLLNREIQSLADNGAEFIQIDEPGLTNLPYGLNLKEAADCINRTVAGFQQICGLHVCYGNNASRPYSDRNCSRLLPALNRISTPIL